jgi:hypothetical protein
MIIDNPHVMRQVIREINPRFTHPGAEEIYTEKKNELDAYAARWGKLADEVWQREYVDQNDGQKAPRSADAAR